MIEWRRRCFLPDLLAELFFTIRILLLSKLMITASSGRSGMASLYGVDC